MQKGITGSNPVYFPKKASLFCETFFIPATELKQMD